MIADVLSVEVCVEQYTVGIVLRSLNGSSTRCRSHLPLTRFAEVRTGFARPSLSVHLVHCLLAGTKATSRLHLLVNPTNPHVGGANVGTN